MTIHSKTLLIAASLTVLAASPALAQMSGHSGHKMDGVKHDRSAHMVEALATVDAVLVDENRISLTHGAVPQVSWPAATMKFPVGEKIALTDFSPGDRVQFTLHRAKNGALPLVELCKTTTATVQSGLCAPAVGQMKMMTGMDGHDMGAMAEPHSNMDHSKMDQSKMDHGSMDHSTMGGQGQDMTTQVSATGKVLHIDDSARTLRIKHDPIAAISWPVMTMVFEAGDGVILSGLSKGQTISFDFDPDGEDGYVISAIRPAVETSKHDTHGEH